MPNWSQLSDEINKTDSPIDTIRRKYLRQLQNYRKRNVIAYYSSFLTKQGLPTSISDADKEMFMTAVHGLDKSKGLDLLLNTEGGAIAATESIVDYLYKIFSKDIAVFVPQIAMSAGTLIACAAKEIYLGLQSNLGPIDPQLNGISAKLVLNEFSKAKEELALSRENIAFWQILLSKYPPTFIQLCQNACKWSEELAKKWLSENMLKEHPDKDKIIAGIIKNLTEPEINFSHGRHLHLEQLEQVGLKISKLEKDPRLQDLVLTVHHAYMHTFLNTAAYKIVENHKGNATVLLARQ